MNQEPLIDPDVVPGAEGHRLPPESGPEAEESQPMLDLLLGLRRTLVSGKMRPVIEGSTRW